MRSQHVILRCPHCQTAGQHPRGDLVGDWVLCHVCELPFAWREARMVGGREGRRVAQPHWRPTRQPHTEPRDVMTTALEQEIVQVKQGDHLCLIYQTREEQFASVIPFMMDGLAAGERCVYIVDERTADDVLRALGARGVDVAREMERGALRLLTKRDTYLRSGVFDPQLMIGLLFSAQEEALADGFTGLRVTGEMTWALGTETGTDRLIEYEALLNNLFPGSNALAVCQYNRKRFSPGIIRQVLCTHPIAIIGRRVCHNLYYELPEAVLGQMSEGKHVDWMISQLERAHTVEEALRRSETDYRALVEHATYGIYRSSLDDRFLSVNPALVEMLGYESKAELLTVKPSELYRDKHAQRIEEVEVRWKRKDGTPITVRLSGCPVRNHNRELECFEMIAEEVTEQQRIEAQLRQAQKMEAIGQLTGGIAHDFNNILTVIMSNTELATKSLPEEAEEARADLEEARAAGERGSAMIRKLLGFSRTEKLSFQPVDLGRLVTNTTRVLQRVLPESIEIQISVAESIGAVRADPGALEQILLNLATNARDAMPDGGTLHVECRRERLDAGYHATHPWVIPGEYGCIVVSDTGVGMDEETQRRVFEPFYTTKPAGEGTGLGMAMIYGLVKQQSGFVHVYSELGEGTEVKLYFPAMDVEAVTETQQPSYQTCLPVGTETILVVEDEVAIRRATKRALERQGYSVMTAADGEEALETMDASGSEIDLIVTDLIMPRLGGHQLYDALTQQGRQVKFLFTSGYSTQDLTESSSFASSVPFLHKPWNVTNLVQCVRDTLDEEV